MGASATNDPRESRLFPISSVAAMVSFNPRPCPFPLSSSVFFLVFLLTACGGGDSYTVNTGDIAQRYLPTTREVEYHPDSLGALSLTEGDEKFEMELASSYESLHRKWSSTYQSMGTRRSRRTRSYATFWSRELSLASLEAETAVSSLSKEQAEDLLAEERQEYQNALQIDVYWFEAEGNSLLAGPGSRVELEVKGKTYRPTTESHGPLRDTFLPQGSGRAIYRRNTFRFARVVDDTDLLKDAGGATLTINRSDRQGRVRFSWTWAETAQSDAPTFRRNRIDRLPRSEALVADRRAHPRH